MNSEKKKKKLLKCNFGPESETTYAESVAVTKSIFLHKIPFQFCTVYLLQFCSVTNLIA